MKISDHVQEKLLEVKESWKNVQILQKEYYHDPIKSNRRSLEQGYSVLAIDVEYLLKRLDLLDEET